MSPEFAVKVEELRWKKSPVLNDGFVTLVDVMGDEASVVQAARVSYGQDARKFDKEFGDPNDMNEFQIAAAVKKTDLKLIRYLLRHRHTTPFEMVELKFLVRVPMDCWRQWIRHRTASVNEYSTRYTEAIDSCQTTDPGEWRLQSDKNKQGSSGFLSVDDGLVDGSDLTRFESELQSHARQVYEQRLRYGVAREQARKDLPLSTYTEAYWKIDLHNFLHFTGLRMHSHAQIEIQKYARAMWEIVEQLYPNICQAFKDYHPHMDAILLTRLEVDFQKKVWVYDPSVDEKDMDIWCKETVRLLNEIFSDKRERQECVEKMIRLETLPVDFQLD